MRQPALIYPTLTEPLLPAYSNTGSFVAYLIDAAATGSNHMRLHAGVSAPATATISTGWTCGLAAAGLDSKMERGVERAAATFLSPTADLPNNTLGDCFRTEERLRGTFAPGTWTLTVPLIAVSSGGDQDVNLTIRVYKSDSDTTALGTGTIVSGGSSDIANLTTAIAQLATFSFSPGQLVFDDEHLFIQIACSTRNPNGGGSVSTRDVLIRVGQDAKLVAPDFTYEVADTVGRSPRFAGQVVRRRYFPVGY